MKQNPIDYLRDLCNSLGINNLYYEKSNTVFIYSEPDSTTSLKIDISKMDRQCPNIDARKFEGTVHIVSSVDGGLGTSGLMPDIVIANELMFSDKNYGGLIILPTHYSSQKIKVEEGLNYHRLSNSPNVTSSISYCPTQFNVEKCGRYNSAIFGVPIVAGMFAEKRKFKDPRELVCITSGGFTGNYYEFLSSVSKDPNNGIISLFLHLFKVRRLFKTIMKNVKKG
jgi:hypothetical protein